MSWERLHEIELDIEAHKKEIERLIVLREEELNILKAGHNDMSSFIEELQRLLKQEQTVQVKKQIAEIHRIIENARRKQEVVKF